MVLDYLIPALLLTVYHGQRIWIRQSSGWAEVSRALHPKHVVELTTCLLDAVVYSAIGLAIPLLERRDQWRLAVLMTLPVLIRQWHWSEPRTRRVLRALRSNHGETSALRSIVCAHGFFYWEAGLVYFSFAWSRLWERVLTPDQVQGGGRAVATWIPLLGFLVTSGVMMGFLVAGDRLLKRAEESGR